MDLKNKIWDLKYKIKQEERQIYKNAKQDVNLLYVRIKVHPLLCLSILVGIYIVYRLLFVFPQQQVSSFGINNITTVAILENQYRLTMAQIIGGSAVLLTLYFAWENIKATRDGQITDRYTRAIDQLGSDKSSIRVGGIYALERISDESKVYHWSIMEVLTDYARKNSSVYSDATGVNIEDESTSEEDESKSDYEMKPEIQAIVSVIRRRSLQNINVEESQIFTGQPFFLDLHGTNLQYADLEGAHLEEAKLYQANLKGVDLLGANLFAADMRYVILDDANLEFTNFTSADLTGATFVNTYISPESIFDFAKLNGVNFEKTKLYSCTWENAKLKKVNFTGRSLINANFSNSYLKEAIFTNTNLDNADFTDANLEEADLKEALNLSIVQLSKAKTLFNAKLRNQHETALKKQHPNLFEKPEPNETDYDEDV